MLKSQGHIIGNITFEKEQFFLIKFVKKLQQLMQHVM